jgi:hypothetical protein
MMNYRYITLFRVRMALISNLLLGRVVVSDCAYHVIDWTLHGPPDLVWEWIQSISADDSPLPPGRDLN